MPTEMITLQATTLGGQVYVGGGGADSEEDTVFRYDLSNDEWSRLPASPVSYFALATFLGNLIIVGGKMVLSLPGLQGIAFSGKVYRLKESQEWEEYLKPMPTARRSPSVVTCATESAIVAAGGTTCSRNGKGDLCSTVEVYNNETSQWYTADPLPAPQVLMTTVAIGDSWYLMGGICEQDFNVTSAVLYTPLTTLINNTTTHQSSSQESVWKMLPDTPMIVSAAACLSGNLLAVGGYKDGTVSPAVHVFLPITNSWVRLNGDMPEPRFGSTAVPISPNQVFVVGGNDECGCTKTAFIGSITM